MKIAVLADTHGNATAFRAVLTDIRARGAEQIIHLGDIAGKGPQGSECCALAREHCDIVVRGNWDVFLLRHSVELPSDAARWFQSELSEEDRTWLGSLPYSHDFSLGGRNIRGFHASADSEFHRIYPSLDTDQWDALFTNTDVTGGGAEPDLVIYGDIHWVWERTLENRTVINCGSVGNPLDQPVPSYLLLSDAGGDLSWEIVRVPYDVDIQLDVARSIGMPEYDAWEQELRTAIYAR